jgi:hypothetical protein
MSDRLDFTGDGSYWVNLPLLKAKGEARGKVGGDKNPDFIVKPDVEGALPSKVVEVFGEYWHGESITGMTKEEHELNTKEAYADVGIECLVLWGSEIREDEEKVRERLLKFLG